VKTIDHLLQNSGLPGPRGNLSLLHFFSQSATLAEVKECLSYCTDDVSNSPEEFVAMCGIVGYCILHKATLKGTIEFIRRFASHGSWRVREAVAIGIQEIAQGRLSEILDNLGPWIEGNDLEKRAVVAAVCEPKLLKVKVDAARVLKALSTITSGFEKIGPKLSDDQNPLRKALGYGWSVAIAALPSEGKAAFETIAHSRSKHIQWIVRENLKKNRLAVMDKNWVERMAAART
jgi:hypothetical protein